MKPLLLASGLLAVVLLSSCTAYKSGQTPDDVYYSPGRVVAQDEVRNQEKEEYRNYFETPDDNYIRQKVRNRDRWSNIDDIDYWYSYNNGCGCNYNSYGYNSWNNYGYNSWNSWNSWNSGWSYYNNPWRWNYYNSWNNPYGGWYQPVYAVTKYPTRNEGPRRNLGGYGNNNYNNNNYYGGRPTSTRSGSSGTLFKSVFSNSNNGGSSSTYDRPARTFEPSSSSSNSSSSGSSRTSGSSSSGSSSSGSSSSGSSSSGRGGRGG